MGEFYVGDYAKTLLLFVLRIEFQRDLIETSLTTIHSLISIFSCSPNDQHSTKFYFYVHLLVPVIMPNVTLNAFLRTCKFS